MTPFSVARSPASSARVNATPSLNALGVDGRAPALTAALWPVPSPRMNRPPLAASSDAAADAVTSGCREMRFVTHAASVTRSVHAAAMPSATHRSIALPGVSATPTRSKPRRSPSVAIRVVYAGSYGQKKKPDGPRPATGEQP